MYEAMTRREFSLAGGAALAAAQERTRLIIIGDDIGAVHAIGEGTILAYREGIMRSANLIVPGPWLREAVEQLAANPGLDVGIHLTLTSEWDSVKWRPLTVMPSLVDGEGFLPATTKQVAAEGVSLVEVERELRAQIEMGRRLVPRAGWLSTHMGSAVATPRLRDLTLRLSREYKLPMQGDIPGGTRIRAPYKNGTTPDEKVEAMVKMIEELKPGTYSMVDHPATDTAEMRRVGHEGSRSVAAERSGILYAWTHSRVKAAVIRHGVELTSVGANVRMPA